MSHAAMPATPDPGAANVSFTPHNRRAARPSGSSAVVPLRKFAGRIIADVALADGRSLATLVIAEGLGREYDGGVRLGWCDGE